MFLCSKGLLHFLPTASSVLALPEKTSRESFNPQLKNLHFYLKVLSPLPLTTTEEKDLLLFWNGPCCDQDMFCLHMFLCWMLGPQYNVLRGAGTFNGRWLGEANILERGYCPSCLTTGLVTMGAESNISCQPPLWGLSYTFASSLNTLAFTPTSLPFKKTEVLTRNQEGLASCCWKKCTAKYLWTKANFSSQ